MAELAIPVEPYGSPELIEGNVRYSRSLGLRELTMAPCVNGGLFVICASGPSIKDNLDGIRKDQEDGYPICAIKGAYDFLRENGITPDLYLSVEPRDRPIKYPSDKTVYLMASRCNPKNFDELKDYCVCLWHSWTNQEEPYYKDTLGIGGGSTSGLRAFNVGWILGFKRFKTYGMDSCLVEGEKRVGQGKIDKLVSTTGIRVGDKEFACNGGMAAQANEFQMLYEIMPGIQINVVGGGLLAAIVEERKRSGLPA